jgi:hypothetical protein
MEKPKANDPRSPQGNKIKKPMNTARCIEEEVNQMYIATSSKKQQVEAEARKKS